ncbi:MAG: FGGY-family carbohydrate kinase [Pseudomonadota bacterium]
MADVVCVLDLGTTGIKAALVDAEGSIVIRARAPASPMLGDALEFDAVHTLETVERLIREVVSARPGDCVAAVSSSCQRATVVPMGEDGRPAGPALSWQDPRGGAAAARLADAMGPRGFTSITGLPPSFLWTLGKLLWLRDTRPGIWRGTARIALLNDLVLRHLGAVEATTDLSNASLTGLLDLTSLDWSGPLLDAAGLPRSILPGLVRSGSEVGTLSPGAARTTGLPRGTLLVAGGGDQQCAALGQGVLEPGDAGLCLGTAAVVSCPTDRPVTDANGFFCTVHAAPDRWVLEGLHNSFGSALAWARGALMCEDEATLEALAEAGDPGGAVFVPHLAGVGSPDHLGAARGALVGLSLSHGRAAMARAVYEGVAWEMRRILDAMETGGPRRRLVVSGGVSTGRLMPRLLADLTGRSLVLREVSDASLLGAAALAWTGAGRFPDASAASRAMVADVTAQVLTPDDKASHPARYRRYLAAVETLLAADWNREDDV